MTKDTSNIQYHIVNYREFIHQCQQIFLLLCKHFGHIIDKEERLFYNEFRRKPKLAAFR